MSIFPPDNVYFDHVSDQNMTLFVGLCTIAFLAAVVSGDHTTVCVRACMCVCVCAWFNAKSSEPGAGATALVLHGSILALCQSSAPPSSSW